MLHGEVVGDFGLPSVAPNFCQLPTQRQHLPSDVTLVRISFFLANAFCNLKYSFSPITCHHLMSFPTTDSSRSCFASSSHISQPFSFAPGIVPRCFETPSHKKLICTAFALGPFFSFFPNDVPPNLESPKTQINVRGFTKQPPSTFATVPWFMLYLGGRGTGSVTALLQLHYLITEVIVAPSTARASQSQLQLQFQGLGCFDNVLS